MSLHNSADPAAEPMDGASRFFADGSEPTAVDQGTPDESDVSETESIDDFDDDLEFQPRARRRLHWLTIVLICLVIWGGGFLAGVLVDRAFSVMGG